ncbi:hypothetical protein GGX14DRAFT_545098 [Mycena pura]|uniref:Uncharacterized protein n=1 Tax=Mycena pura TaxID=153505 RepID=A0AAD6V0M5_9AGAR|nr:hypothetical protein GGX14DRAFT_545098 [Mycena pura]
MPIHEFTSAIVIAKLNMSGHISLSESFKPLEGVAEPSKALWAPGLSLYFDRTCENGVGELSVYVPYDTPTPSACREEALYSDPTPHAEDPINSGRTSPLLQESPASRTALSEQLDTIWPADFFTQQTFQARSDADDLGSNRGIFSEQLLYSGTKLISVNVAPNIPSIGPPGMIPDMKDIGKTSGPMFLMGHSCGCAVRLD